MIIIHLTGGLGNQLFQYAFARSLSYNLDVELFLDLSLFSHNEKRKHVIFGLHSFNIKGIVGYYPYVDETSVGINFTEKKKLNKYVEGIPFPNAIHDYKLIKSLENIKLPVYFQGYYQNQIKNKKFSYITENYFKDNIDLIHEDLKYSLPLSFNSQILIEDMRKFDSVALHIRHGDYENYPKFGFCSTDYYHNAISLLGSELDNPKFFIFTEDPDWVEDNLIIKYPYKIIRFNEQKNSAGRGYAELLKVMSMCDHFIIANSTFSWWAAFLSENKYKIIISPTPWFQDRTILATDTIDNVKTINLKNDYFYIFNSSSNLIYDLKLKDIDYDGLSLIGEGEYLKVMTSDINSKLFLKNISTIKKDSKAIINFSFISNSFNGLMVYYKMEGDEKYSDKNSLNLNYYENEEVNHCLILPKGAILDEIMIKPYIFEKENHDFIKFKSIKIKEYDENMGSI